MVKSREDRDTFVASNLGLVHLCVRRFLKRGIEYDDLYSAGCVGLIKSVDAFDENRGVCFSTYAVPVILGEIKRLFRDGGAIKVSRSLRELSIKVSRTREIITKSTGNQPTVAQLAEALEVSPEEIAEAINASAPPVSLTGQNKDSDEEHQLDIPADDREEEITDKLSIKAALSRLDEKDKSLIILRYFRGKTQVETAKQLNMTQVQVSRREKKLLLFMREELGPG